MDEQFLYAGSTTGKVEIFDMSKKFKRVGVIKGLGKHILGLQVNDKAIFVISKDGKFTAIDKDTKKTIFDRKFKSVGNFKTLQSLAISDKYVCFASSGKVHAYTWDVNTMELTEIGEFGLGIDTHVSYCSQKLEWTKNKNPHKIEEDLKKLFPKEYWNKVNSTLVRFGKTHMSRKKKDDVLEEIKKVT